MKLHFNLEFFFFSTSDMHRQFFKSLLSKYGDSPSSWSQHHIYWSGKGINSNNYISHPLLLKRGYTWYLHLLIVLFLCCYVRCSRWSNVFQSIKKQLIIKGWLIRVKGEIDKHDGWPSVYCHQYMDGWSVHVTCDV